MLAIQKQFPEADGNYTGFKDPSIAELDLTFLSKSSPLRKQTAPLGAIK